MNTVQHTEKKEILTMRNSDYRKALELGFDDKQKQRVFINRMQLFFQKPCDIDISYDNERDFCYELGIPCQHDNKSIFDFNMDEPSGLARMWPYLEPYTGDFRKFLYATVVFINTYIGSNKNKRLLLRSLKQALEDSDIDYEVLEDSDGYFFFPKGAQELDDGLISQPLRWLNEYPKTKEVFSVALKQYSSNSYVRDVADNFRKSLEMFFQEFLNNKRNLRNNTTLIFNYLGEKNAEPELRSIMKSIINAYDNLNNSAVKHNDTLDKTYLEFIMYQTGIIIRTLIVVKNSKEAEI